MDAFRFSVCYSASLSFEVAPTKLKKTPRPDKPTPIVRGSLKLIMPNARLQNLAADDLQRHWSEGFRRGLQTQQELFQSQTRAFLSTQMSL